MAWEETQESLGVVSCDGCGRLGGEPARSPERGPGWVTYRVNVSQSDPYRAWEVLLELCPPCTDDIGKLINRRIYDMTVELANPNKAAEVKRVR